MRAGKRFLRDEALFEQLGPGRLRKALDRFGLWRVRTTSRSSSSSRTLRPISTCRACVIGSRDRRRPLGDQPAGVRPLRLCRWFRRSWERYVGLIATGGGHVAIDHRASW